MRKWIVLGLIALSFGLLLTVRRTPSLSVQTAPEFILPDIQGQGIRLSQLKGKVVMLNIWTTWCPPCRKEMPTMETLHRRLQNSDFVMLAASQDVDGKSTVLTYLQEGGVTFQVVLDVKGEVGNKY